MIYVNLKHLKTVGRALNILNSSSNKRTSGLLDAFGGIFLNVRTFAPRTAVAFRMFSDLRRCFLIAESLVLWSAVE